GKPFMTTFHNAYGLTPFFKRYYNAIMARGARVIAISRFVGDHASSVYGVKADRLRVIPRGVDVKRFDAAAVDSGRIASLRQSWLLPEGVPVIMLPGRLTRWKGQLVLIKALAKLGRRDMICAMVGGGSRRYRHEIENLAERLGVGANLHVFENCRDM